MNYKQVAEDVVKHIGGKENVSHFEHCSTRLRFSLVDKNKVNVPALEATEGVMAVKWSGQIQVVIGNEVVEVYDEVQKLLGDVSSNTALASGEKQSLGSRFMDFLIGVFQPLVPAIAGGGVLKSLLMLFSVLGWMNPESQNYKIFMMIGDAPLYFLPILVAYTTATKLKVNPLVAMSIVGALLLPPMTEMLTKGGELFGFGIQNIAYAYQVFPAILTVILYAFLERFWTKVTPKPIRIFFVPLMSMAITVPIALLILGPLGFNFGQGFAAVILTIFKYAGWVAVALLAAILPFMVATGMHKAMLPYAIAAMGNTGKEVLYLPASLAHNISESGACFAVALRTKDPKMKATSISAGISALFGITEPALYGVTLQNKKVLSGVIVGALIGGAAIGLLAVEAFVLVGPGVASMTMYVSESNPKNIIYAIVGLVVSFLVSFIVTLVLFKDKVVEEIKEEKEQVVAQTDDLDEVLDVVVANPVKGQYVPLENVKDSVFSSKVMGEGFGVYPTEGMLYAPAAGRVMMLFDTHHALGLKLENGAEMLFHIGLDTVQLQGKHFKPLVKIDDYVKKGDALIQFDIEAIKQAGFDPTVINIVTNKDDYNVQLNEVNDSSNLNSNTMTIIRKGE
ncbi:beta-glucoside-specific PTS transporter subunit IIABC [Macrococcus animalis]|uniref:beta-glucoside-specific PTS transporter subunit IIABC n=1 Tax=Macrococcus animalis TaxID=3395467 RepID=UPI0039BE8E3B